MKKKILALLLAVTCALSCTACEGKEESKTDGSAQNEMETAGGEYEYPAEDAEAVLWESPFGYSMTYDSTVFTLDDTGEGEVFIYNTAEKLDAPIYIAVQSYPDMDAQTLAEGLVLQSGIDGLEIQDNYFASVSVETKLVYIEKEVEGIKQIQIYNVIPKGEGSLLVEMGTYAGVPESVDWKMEETINTFMLTGDELNEIAGGIMLPRD